MHPTDTIWGIGCDACNEAAVSRVYDIKQRERGKPFIVLVSDAKMLRKHVQHLHPRIETLLAFHTRPLTIIYDKGAKLAPSAMAADGSVGIRIVQDALCQEIICSLGRPIISTSANISNEPFPSNFSEVSLELRQAVDYIAPFRQHETVEGQPSVVARLGADGELEFLRE